jgi:hypothetical protein
VLREISIVQAEEGKQRFPRHAGRKISRRTKARVTTKHAALIVTVEPPMAVCSARVAAVSGTDGALAQAMKRGLFQLPPAEFTV